jgi:hypothetical protein
MCIRDVPKKNCPSNYYACQTNKGREKEMTYCFTCKHCGRTTEKQLPMSKSGKRKKCVCGKFMKRDIQAEHGKFKNTPGKWPMDETGAAIFTSQDHRARHCKEMGLYDRNAGYGDRAPEHNMRKRKVRNA